MGACLFSSDKSMKHIELLWCSFASEETTVGRK